METSKETVNLKILKRSRTLRRILFSKEVNETLEELKGVSPDEYLLIGKRDFIVQYYQQIKEYDEKIEIELVNAEDYDEQAVMKELESTANYAKMYGDIQIRISKILEAKAEEKKAISEAGSEGSRRANLKLPNMELPFKKIHEDKDLNNDEKMHYLVQAMIPGSRAHRLFGAHTYTGENYESAIRALKNRFWDKNRTPEAGYGRDDDQDVEQGKGDRLKALMSFLRAEVKAQQRINFSRIGVGENNPRPNFPSRPLHFNKNNGPRATQLYASKNKKYKSKGSFLSPNYERKTKCIFCDGMGHENWKCFKIGRMTREEQLKKMSDAGVCFKCLKRNNLRRHCRTKIICQNCGGPHYLLFCRGNNSRRDSFSEIGGSSKERKNNSLVQNQKSSVLLTQSCASEILLMTKSTFCWAESLELHVFCDASKEAFATVEYMRSQMKEGVK
ncbi:hypothetical protein LAZ67_1001279 [Cordylochernes scorpioides]|uniref:Uncharacterized protein n=1 Tax=Cordylochernes scorpioides TaxID=51811 RepID=A0ABY6JYK5_9ARAC|nr:hypothetical protein LAZ67_1001279 [Cordylochernes scorpioides]